MVRPDGTVVDIEMPHAHTDEGITAAQEVRRSHPNACVLVLSQYLKATKALRLLEETRTAPIPTEGPALSVSMVALVRHPTMRRESTSVTSALNTVPDQVGT